MIGLGMAVIVTKEPLRRGVLVQCAFRSNYALIGLSLVSALGGDGALAIASILSAFTIPVFNILAVIALSMFTGKPFPGGRPFGIWRSRSRKIR